MLVSKLLGLYKPFGLFRERNIMRYREHSNHEFVDMGLHFACVWCNKTLQSAEDRCPV